MCNIVTQLVSSDDGKNLSLQTGEGLSVELEELAGAGYVWQSHVEPDGVLKLESSTRDTGSTTAMGAAAIRKMSFCAVAPGSANVRLEMRRPWEASGAAAKSLHFTVTVSK